MRKRIYKDFGVTTTDIYEALKPVDMLIHSFCEAVWNIQEEGNWDPSDFDKYINGYISLNMNAKRLKAAFNTHRKATNEDKNT